MVSSSEAKFVAEDRSLLLDSSFILSLFASSKMNVIREVLIQSLKVLVIACLVKSVLRIGSCSEVD